MAISMQLTTDGQTRLANVDIATSLKLGTGTRPIADWQSSMLAAGGDLVTPISGAVYTLGTPANKYAIIRSRESTV